MSLFSTTPLQRLPTLPEPLAVENRFQFSMEDYPLEPNSTETGISRARIRFGASIRTAEHLRNASDEKVQQLFQRVSQDELQVFACLKYNPESLETRLINGGCSTEEQSRLKNSLIVIATFLGINHPTQCLYS